MGATNNDGYTIALDQLADELPEGVTVATKSALSQFRKTISYQFFSDLYHQIITGWFSERPTWKGFYVSAIDGDDVSLPATQDVVDSGYRGTPVRGKRETYYPTAYTTFETDVLTGVPVNVCFSKDNDEIGGAIEMLRNSVCPEKTLTIYDRFYLSTRLLDEYTEENSGYFVCRCKSGKTFKEVAEFIDSDSLEQKTEINGINLRLVKYKCPEADSWIVIATNLPDDISREEIGGIYFRRWEAEIANKDRTYTMKIEQFRARDLNGILQEFYASLILQSLARMISARVIEEAVDPLKSEYRRPNLKAVLTRIVRTAYHLLIMASNDAFRRILQVAEKTTEKRRHFSRKYERVNRRKIGNLYSHQSVIPRRG